MFIDSMTARSQKTRNSSSKASLREYLFCFCFFLALNADDPVLNREGKKLKLPDWEDNALTLLNSTLKDTYNQMCWCFDAAVLISPLLMLTTISKRKVELARSVMLEVSDPSFPLLRLHYERVLP